MTSVRACMTGCAFKVQTTIKALAAHAPPLDPALGGRGPRAEGRGLDRLIVWVLLPTPEPSS